MNPLDLAPSLMPITARPAVVFERGEGSYLFDGDGRRWVDWVQGWAVNTLGHASPVITQALDAQSRKLVTPSPAFYNRPALALADLLTANSCFDQVFFASSGAEANEGAIKLARRWGSLHKDGAYEIVTFVNAFHGRTLATMSASGKPGWDRMFPPQVDGFPKATLNDLDSVRRLIGPRTVAVMLEPIQGEAGVWPATVAFLRGLRALCDEHRLLLIVDEVQTGCARTGELFAHQHAGIEPDVMTLGKGIGGGVPLSALLAKAHASCFQPGDQGGTYCGNPLMCAVGHAIITTLLDPAFEARRAASAAHLRAQVQALSDELGLKGLRGRGHLLALDLGRPIGAEVVERAREQGLLVNSPRPDSLRLMPALDIPPGVIDEGVAVLRRVLRAMPATA